MLEAVHVHDKSQLLQYLELSNPNKQIVRSWVWWKTREQNQYLTLKCNMQIWRILCCVSEGNVSIITERHHRIVIFHFVIKANAIQLIICLFLQTIHCILRKQKKWNLLSSHQRFASVEECQYQRIPVDLNWNCPLQHSDHEISHQRGHAHS